MIKPNYVTHEVAKLLKEKGFKELCSHYYSQEKLIPYEYESSCSDSYLTVDFDTFFENWNERNLTIDGEEVISAPEHWLVIEWLETNFKIFIDTKCINSYSCDNFGYTIHKDNDEIKVKNGFNTRKEAYDDAFKYILTEII